MQYLSSTSLRAAYMSLFLILMLTLVFSSSVTAEEYMPDSDERLHIRSIGAPTCIIDVVTDVELNIHSESIEFESPEEDPDFIEMTATFPQFTDTDLYPQLNDVNKSIEEQLLINSGFMEEMPLLLVEDTSEPEPLTDDFESTDTAEEDDDYADMYIQKYFTIDYQVLALAYGCFSIQMTQMFHFKRSGSLPLSYNGTSIMTFDLHSGELLNADDFFNKQGRAGVLASHTFVSKKELAGAAGYELDDSTSLDHFYLIRDSLIVVKKLKEIDGYESFYSGLEVGFLEAVDPEQEDFGPYNLRVALALNQVHQFIKFDFTTRNPANPDKYGHLMFNSLAHNWHY